MMLATAMTRMRRPYPALSTGAASGLEGRGIASEAPLQRWLARPAPVAVGLRPQYHHLAGLRDPVLLDRPDAQCEAHESEEAHDDQHKTPVRHVPGHAEGVHGDYGRRANAYQIVEPPEVEAAKREELDQALWPPEAEVELVRSEHAQEQRQHERRELRLPLSAALRVGPVLVALAEGQSRPR